MRTKDSFGCSLLSFVQQCRPSSMPNLLPRLSIHKLVFQPSLYRCLVAGGEKLMWVNVCRVCRLMSSDSRSVRIVGEWSPFSQTNGAYVIRSRIWCASSFERCTGNHGCQAVLSVVDINHLSTLAGQLFAHHLFCFVPLQWLYSQVLYCSELDSTPFSSMRLIIVMISLLSSRSLRHVLPK
jgi:hypothetical protein